MPVNPAAFAPFNLGDIIERNQAMQLRRMQMEQAREERDAQRAEKEAYGQIFSGGMDERGALRRPDGQTLGNLARINPKAAMEVQQYFNSLDENSRKREEAKWKAAGPLLVQAQQMPYEQRRQFIMSAAPVLTANGWSPDEIAQFDPTDENVKSLSTAAMTVEQVLGANKLTWHPIGENGSFATDQFGNPVGEGNPFAPQARPAPQGQPGNMQSFRDPGYDRLESSLEQEYGLPQGLMGRIRTLGERSNANQVSPAGARTVYQIIPETRLAFAKKYGVDAYKSPENAARVAALHLKESIERGEDPVTGYIGGPDRSKHGPQTRAYAARVNGARRVSSKAQYDALPSGTQYIAPDGSLRTKN